MTLRHNGASLDTIMPFRQKWFTQTYTMFVAEGEQMTLLLYMYYTFSTQLYRLLRIDVENGYTYIIGLTSNLYILRLIFKGDLPPVQNPNLCPLMISKSIHSSSPFPDCPAFED